jgi:ATP-dependent helicase/nuclease subunit A
MKANPRINLFFVGDAKQSIYSFRGAEVKVFQREKQKANELIQLYVNFRSVSEILDFINDFFSKTNFLFQFEEPYIRMKSHRGEYGNPRVEILISRDSRVKEDVNVERKVEIEAEAIALRIKEMVDGKEISPNKIVEVRDRNIQAESEPVKVENNSKLNNIEELNFKRF